MKDVAAVKPKRKKKNNLLPALNQDNTLEVAKELGAPKFKLIDDNTLAQKETDLKKFYGQIIKTAGSEDPDFFTVLLTQTSNININSADDPVKAANYTSAFLHGLKPRDQTEAVLFAQMAGTHNLIMEFMRRAIYKDQHLDAAEKYTYRACKLMNLFLRQIEILEKYRGKSTQQKVIVEHVNVGEGGKAIVGNIAVPIGGGRDEEQKQG